MSCAVAWSGGKDSALALDRAVRQGLGVTHLFNLYEGSTGRVRFHGVPGELIARQADALGLRLVQLHTHPADFATAFAAGLDRLVTEGVRALVFGNIHLADVRAWYEERTTAAGFRHIEPLWGEDTGRLLREFHQRGYRTLVVSVSLELGRREWLGRELDPALARELLDTPDADAAGERGEYHTFVWDGPLFLRPLPVSIVGELELEGHAFADLVAADTAGGPPRPES